MAGINKLSELSVKKAKPKERIYRLADGGGMYLEVMPNGSKYWRLKYRFGGKEKRLAFGVYPSVSLSAAREKARLVKVQLTEGNDPGELKKQEKQINKHLYRTHFQLLLKSVLRMKQDLRGRLFQVLSEGRRKRLLGRYGS